jgi:hypothetical protein
MKMYHIIFGQGVKYKKKVQLTSRAQCMKGFYKKPDSGLVCDLECTCFTSCVTD